MSSLKKLDDEQLKQAYNQAVEMGLDREFIRILVEEMTYRGLFPEKVSRTLA